MSIESFFSRHTKKTDNPEVEAKDYPGVTPEGVELARKKDTELIEMIEHAPSGAVIWLGGITKHVRTCSTMDVYLESIKAYIDAHPEKYMYLDAGALQAAHSTGQRGKLDIIMQAAETGKKVIIDFPLAIKNFLETGWSKEDGTPTEYMESLQRRITSQSARGAFEQWFKDKGVVEGKKIGPDPEEVAVDFIEGLMRLEQFTKKYFSNRPVMVGSVGHSANMTALLHYTHGKGAIRSELFQDIPDIKETDMFSYNISGENLIIRFKDQEYQTAIPVALLEKYNKREKGVSDSF